MEAGDPTEETRNAQETQKRPESQERRRGKIGEATDQGRCGGITRRGIDCGGAVSSARQVPGDKSTREGAPRHAPSPAADSRRGEGEATSRFGRW